jgi:hypothetical protein
MVTALEEQVAITRIVATEPLVRANLESILHKTRQLTTTFL